MIDRLWQIVKDGNRVIKKELKSTRYLIYFWICPILLAFWLFKLNINFTKVASDVIGGIGLFAGLMFTLLFIITDNYNKKKEKLKGQSHQAAISHLATYKEFANNTISLISYSIIIAGLVIATTVVSSSIIEIDYKSIDIVLQLLLSIFLFQFVVTIILILNAMYTMLWDDINNKLSD